MLDLAVGDVVVYGAHGAGTVATRETRSVQGEQQTVVVIALANQLSVQLPLDLAREQLRPVVDESEIANLERVLRDVPTVSGESWLKRRQAAEAKLGDAVGLAEIIRDGNVREAAATGKASTRLSPGDRELVRRARTLLAGEIAMARDVTRADAEAWIDRQLVAS